MCPSDNWKKPHILLGGLNNPMVCWGDRTNHKNSQFFYSGLMTNSKYGCVIPFLGLSAPKGYQGQYRSSANEAVAIVTKDTEKARVLYVFFFFFPCLNETRLQESQTSVKIQSNQELILVVEDQTREHLNELDMCNSSGSDGMLPEANQCRCEDTVKYS